MMVQQILTGYALHFVDDVALNKSLRGKSNLGLKQRLHVKEGLRGSAEEDTPSGSQRKRGRNGDKEPVPPCTSTGPRRKISVRKEKNTSSEGNALGGNRVGAELPAAEEISEPPIGMLLPKKRVIRKPFGRSPFAVRMVDTRPPSHTYSLKYQSVMDEDGHELQKYVFYFFNYR